MASPNDLTRQQLDELDALLQRMLALPITSAEPATPLAPPPPLPELPPPTPRPSSSVGWRADRSTQTSRAPYLAPAHHSTEAEPAEDAEAQYAQPPRAAHDLEAFASARQGFSHNRSEPAHASFPTPAQQFRPAEDDAQPQDRRVMVRGVDGPDRVIRSQESFLAASQELPVSSGYSVAHADFEVVLENEADAKPAVAPVPMILWPLFAMNWLLEFTLGWFGPVGAFMLQPRVRNLLGIVGFLLLLGAAAWSAQGLGWITWPR